VPALYFMLLALGLLCAVVIDCSVPRPQVFSRFVYDSVTADSHVTMPKQQGFNERPNLWKASMFAENISRILLPINMEETKNLGSNRLTHAMIRQGIVALVESRVRDGCTGNNRLVVTKHVALGLDRNTQITQRVAEVNNLVCCNPSCNKL